MPESDPPSGHDADEATVSVPVDRALSVELGLELDSDEAALDEGRETVRPPLAPTQTKIAPYEPQAKFEEPTFVLPVQASAQIAAEPELPAPVEAPPLAPIELPAPVDARPPAATWLGRAAIVLSMLLGVAVIVHHFATADAQPPVGPLRLVAGGEAAAPPREVAPVEIEPADTTKPIPELEEAAAEALGAGRVEEAARLYAALAARAPHRPAFVAAARLLAAKVSR